MTDGVDEIFFLWRHFFSRSAATAATATSATTTTTTTTAAAPATTSAAARFVFKSRHFFTGGVITFSIRPIVFEDKVREKERKGKRDTA